MKLRQGNAYTPVCQSFCSRGSLCPSMHHRSHDWGGLCPGGLCRGSLSVGRGSLSVGRGSLSVGRGSLSVGRGSLSVGRGSLSRGGGLCLGGLLYGKDPRYGNEWVVCILLGCILVAHIFWPWQMVPHRHWDVQISVNKIHNIYWNGIIVNENEHDTNI